MFYAHFVLSKKGPLARIWLAAHWDKKLTKAHVFETNIDSSVEAIIEPKVKMALRTSGHLLLGVVRIYSRKAKYLLADCNEAFVKIKMAFRPGVVDLPEENREAAVSTITLPETFHDFDTTMADLSDIDVQAQFSVNQSRPEEITMREDLGNITLVGDDGFGDMGFDDRTIIQDAQMDDTLYKNPESSNILLDDTLTKDTSTEKPMDIDFDAPPREDGFGDGLDDFEPAGCEDDDDDDNDNFGGGVDHELFGDENFIGEAGGLFEEPPEAPVPEEPLIPEAQTTEQPPGEPGLMQEGEVPHEEQPSHIPQEQTTVMPDQTTLVPNEAEAFALEPLDVTTIGTERKTKRKRKLIVDEQKGIASETMKGQLSDTSEIVTTLDLAPPTKKLMHWKETGGVEKLFALPGRPFASKTIAKFFTRNLSTQKVLDEEDTARDLLEFEAEQPREEEETHHDDGFFPPTEPPSMAEEPSHVEQDSRIVDQSRLSTMSAVSADDSTLAPRRTRARESLANTLQPEPVQPEPVAEPEPLLPEPDVPPPAPLLADTELPPMAAHSDDEDNEHHGFDSDGGDDDHDDGEDLPVDDPIDDPADEIFEEELPEEEPVDNEDSNDSAAQDEMEERRWNKRTQYMLHMFERQLNSGKDKGSFLDLCQRNNRKQVASKFYALLVLKKQQAVEVEQSEPYGDILVTRGPRYQAVY